MMRAGLRSSIAWGTLLVCVLSRAASSGVVERLEAFLHRSWLHLNIDARQLLDDRTSSTVDSGLPGTCQYDVVLVDREGKRLAHRLIEMTMHLDLWENHYVLQGPDGEATFASIAQADSAWSSLRALRLLPLDRLRSQQEYRVRIMVHVQPLAAEDQARISRYVSQRSGSDRDEFALDIGGLFRRLVRKDGGESREIHFESAWFRINDLEVKP